MWCLLPSHYICDAHTSSESVARKTEHRRGRTARHCCSTCRTQQMVALQAAGTRHVRTDLGQCNS